MNYDNKCTFDIAFDKGTLMEWASFNIGTKASITLLYLYTYKINMCVNVVQQ